MERKKKNEWNFHDQSTDDIPSMIKESISTINILPPNLTTKFEETPIILTLPRQTRSIQSIDRPTQQQEKNRTGKIQNPKKKKGKEIKEHTRQNPRRDPFEERLPAGEGGCRPYFLPECRLVGPHHPPSSSCCCRRLPLHSIIPSPSN